MARDPVCNMEVPAEKAVTAERDGKTYFFCSEGCREKFLKEPGDGVSGKTYDLIIIGGGPAGLTAAVYAATLKMDAFLITRDLGGQAIDSTKIENYMGFDFIQGTDLIEKFKYQLIHSHYIVHRVSEVKEIQPAPRGFQVTTTEPETYFARTLILATGMTRRRLNVPGEEEFQRKGVFYGNIQDLAFVEGEDAAVIGGGNSALQMVENLHPVARKIHLVSNSALKADAVVIDRVLGFHNLTAYEGYEVLELSGDKVLQGITIRKKGEERSLGLSVKGVFIAIGLTPNSSLFSHLVECNGRGEVVIGPDCTTSRPGIFAAGDLTNAYGKRIIIASGEGAKAALAARESLLKQTSKRSAS